MESLVFDNIEALDSKAFLRGQQKNRFDVLYSRNPQCHAAKLDAKRKPEILDTRCGDGMYYDII